MFAKTVACIGRHPDLEREAACRGTTALQEGGPRTSPRTRRQLLPGNSPLASIAISYLYYTRPLHFKCIYP